MLGALFAFILEAIVWWIALLIVLGCLYPIVMSALIALGVVNDKYEE